MDTAVQSCTNGCGKAFPRKVHYCPFCGVHQEGPEALVAVVPLAPDIPEIPAPAGKVEAASKPVSAADRDADKKSQDPEPAKADPPAPQPKRVVQQPARRPKSRRWPIWAGAVVVLVVIRALFWSSGSVTVVASPNDWTAVKLDAFKAGTRIVFSAPGAFRLRTATTPPVLVNGGEGDADLSNLPREGVEIRSATGDSVKVVVRKSE